MADKALMVIHTLEDIPTFANEAEEHAFWATHELSDELWDQVGPLEARELPAPRTSGARTDTAHKPRASQGEQQRTPPATRARREP